MQRETLKRLVYIAAAIVVVAGAAAGLIALLGGITGSPGGAPGARARYDVDQQERASLDGIGSITVGAVSTPVAVVEGTGNELAVRLYGTVRTNRAQAVPQLVVRTSGGTVEVRVEHQPTFMVFFNSDLRLEVSLPRSYAKELALRTVSGTIDMPDWRLSALELRTTSGRIDVGTVTAARVSIHSVSGRVGARGLGASTVQISTTSGAVTAAGLTGAVNATSVSGHIDLAWTAMSGASDVATTSGGVELRLPATASLRLDAGSTSGAIRSELPVTVRGTSGPGSHALVGDIGGGANPLRVRTVSGAVDIRKAL